MLKSMLSLFGFLLFYSLSAQPTAPSEFPGIQLGVKFTPHHTVLDYFTKEAANNSNSIKLINYGTTNEGRQLIALFISTPENLKNLEEIRLNNLRNAKLINDGKVSSIGKKSIVWLSYNVHGNETSGTEAALNTYYKLMTDKNFDVLLKDLIIIIDPCLNPDGRERYTNWLTSMSGTNADTNPWAREHQEPWPGGRANHYYFDLNRDWAWQTQVESKARLALYNQWLPQVHVDFHEQSVNNPYYFAPAAEPFHEAITPFQRSFQKTIGTNNAKYFDDNSWLYFTNERFDLFYPSYGDTYPIYTGSIGMTYEQAGGARAGVAVKVDDESILTLKDRIDHHTATGMSTIEVASKNASLLYDEFVKYYSNVMSVSKKDYNTFVLRFNKGDENRFESIKKLMDLNLIQFGSGSGIIKGYDYFSGKSVDYEIKDQDL
ncbi:MAG: M14 family zinc carboxypeptidase, partial [Saprospiraceae bacterium]